MNRTLPKPLPCEQNWQDMAEVPGERARICAKCEKKIINFRGRSWKQIEEQQAQHGNTLCGVYSKQQLKYWGQEPPSPWQLIRQRLSSTTVAAATASIAFGGTLQAQNTASGRDQPVASVQEVNSSETAPTNRYILEGRATVKLPKQDFRVSANQCQLLIPGLHAQTWCDSTGYFRLEFDATPMQLKTEVLYAISPYCSPQEFDLSMLGPGIDSLDIELEYVEDFATIHLSKEPKAIVYSAKVPEPKDKLKRFFRRRFGRKK